MARQKSQQTEPVSAVAVDNTSAQSAEDFEAELASQSAEDGANEIAPDVIRDEPNDDLTGVYVCSDPWWEVTCEGLPKRDVQAPTEAVAEERYRTMFLIRRPKVTARRLETA